MRTDYYFPSCGSGKIHCCQWTPDGEVRAVVQIVHGIAEYVERYDPFAEFLNQNGILVVAEDHMGHGKSVGEGEIKGYFHGGWFSAIDDTYHLLQTTMEEFPGKPYILLGHSMGSFMARTVLARYPDSGIAGAVIVGTGWQPPALLSVAISLCKLVCKTDGEDQPSPKLEKLVFGSYNRRVEHPRTAYDWLNRNDAMVDAYIADPMCGFTSTAGLLRDMLTGIAYIERKENLNRMKKNLPVLFVAGDGDPVGDYGKGVKKAAEAFRQAGMEDVSVKLYPMCRHEILNEINHDEVFGDILQWIVSKAGL